MASRAWGRPLVFALAAASLVRAALPGGRRSAPAKPRRILIAHHLLLGDTVMLTPLIAKCRERWPDAAIVLTCPIAYAGLYSGRPYGARAIPYDPRDVATLRALLAEGPFDLALVPADNRLSWLARAAGARWIVAFSGDSPAYKDWPVDELRAYPDRPQAWGDLVASLVDGPAPAPYRTADWPAPEQSTGRPDRMSADPSGLPGDSGRPAHAAPPGAASAPPVGPYAVLHVGASTPLKQWPAERWRRLGQRLQEQGLTVVLSAGPGEAELAAAVDPDRKFVRPAGPLSLAALWQWLARARIVVCPDTGIAHLARLAGVPTVALFGPGSALLSGGGEFWRDSPFTALTIPDFPCRDQKITMKREVAWIRRCERFPGNAPGHCPEAKCMLALTDDLVWDAVVARAGLRSPPAAGTTAQADRQ